MSSSPVVAGDTYPSIFYAAYNNEVGVASRYLDLGGDIEVRDDQNRTPLLAAAEIGNMKMVVFLLNAGANPAAENGGYTATDVAKTADIKRVIQTFNK